MKERDVERRLRFEAVRRGGYCMKITSEGDAGNPDRCVVLPASWCFIGAPAQFRLVETKNPKTGRVRDIQKYKHDCLKRIGAPVYVLWTTEQVVEFYREWDANR
jgi:Uma2 family endonuclease